MFTRLGVCGEVRWHLSSNPNSWLSSEPVMVPVTRLGMCLTEAQFPPVNEAFYRRQDAQPLSPPRPCQTLSNSPMQSHPGQGHKRRLLDGSFSRLLRHAG